MIRRQLNSLKTASWVTFGLVFLAGLLSCSTTGDRERLTVFAAASLTQAFTEAAAAFEQQHPQYSVRLNFDGSQRLRVQLDHGARADVFASADERQMDLARESGLLATEPVTFATNTLVVAVSTQSRATVHSLADLAGENVKLVMAHPEVPAGGYAKAVIESLSKDPDFGPQYSAQVLENVVSQEPNVRGVLQKVALGEADAGFVYASDVLSLDNILALPVPLEANVVAVYPIAVLRDAVSQESAMTFIQFLTSPSGQRILQDHGFGPIPSLTESTSGGSIDHSSENFRGVGLGLIRRVGEG
ncbi:MAG: molybdate ABC transporter substrate-binding protein [Chloroflexi bacterium]|nr:molybdate ABC transporter substrate-binding protein [Chloroflexota bacterium]